MSWGKAYPNTAAFQGENPDSLEAVAQQQAARDAAKLLILSGAVGDPAGDYSVTLSGHANPGHVKTAGWANDSISVTVCQNDPPPAAPPADATLVGWTPVTA